MDLYEYQGKQLFKRFGIPVSDGRLASTPEEARVAAEELGGQVVVKAQVLTGGRGKAGGVKLADDPADAEQKAKDILGLDIRGHVVKRVWIEKASDIAKEYYLSITFDRGAKQPLFMFTTQGGVEIEEVAEESPDALVRLHVDPLEGFQPWQARRLVYGAGVTIRASRSRSRDRREALRGLRRDRRDAQRDQPADRHARRRGEGARLEVHGRRQRALRGTRTSRRCATSTRCRPRSALAREKGVTYVKLDGEVGILGNGAGLVMSTLDVIALAGGRPANFCDLGGGGDAEGVVDALEVITARPAGEVDLLQHLRRDHALRRGRARHPRRARADDDRAPDRRAARRHERRGGPADPRGRERRRTSTSSRRCSTPRGAPWSSSQ